MTHTKPRTRHVLVVDNSHVARRIGERIRQARTRANLTQAQLSKGRYTAAYISALERGLAKPSMAALTFLSERLGVPVPDLVAEERPAAGRLEADLLLAAGRYQDALDRYDSLLDSAGEDRRQRAEVLRGRAEALCRLERAADAVRAAASAADLFDAMGDEADAAWARYWLAYAQYQLDNTDEARGLLLTLLQRDRDGLQVAPDFRFRVLTALGMVESWDGHPERAIGYMEEARGLADDMSMRQRAAFMAGLALQYRLAGDLERSIRVGHQSLALYRTAETELESISLHTNMALNYVDVGNLARAESHLAEARQAAAAHEDRLAMSEVAEAEARLAFAREDDDLAMDRAQEAVAAVEDGGSRMAAARAHVTLARLANRRADQPEAERQFGTAAQMLRDQGPSGLLRDVLGEWAALRTSWGDASGANELYAEALKTASRR